MARWVSSKVSREVHDLTEDLADGTVLIEFVNKLIEESGTSSYVLTPIYKRPHFTLQKVENVDDFLKFCRLVLKINTCNISAEDVVTGNLKLLLGLIWTLFLYLFSRVNAVSNDSRSIGDIKKILLLWVNTIGRSRALPEVHNFNKDWSLQQEKRPDLILATILDYYIPGLIAYDTYATGKKYANLESLIALAETKLSIPNLADAQDFNVLVPDEKCVVLYLIQWYLHFEQDHGGAVLAPDTPLQFNHCQVASFIEHVVFAVKYKDKYETKALRFLNQLNTHLTKIAGLLLDVDDSRLCDTTIEEVNSFCIALPTDENLDKISAQSEQFAAIQKSFSYLFCVLDKFNHFRTEVKPVLATQDLPELHALFRSVNFELKKCGLPGYEPFKQLSLPVLMSKLLSLEALETKLRARLNTQLAALDQSSLRKIDTNIEYLLQNLRTRGKLVCHQVSRYAECLDHLRKCKAQLGQYREAMSEKHSVAELRLLIDSIDTLEVPATPKLPVVSEYMEFKELVERQTNQKNLTFHDLSCFFKSTLSPEQYKSAIFKEFTKLIPTRKLLTLSESDDLLGALSLDDSDTGHSSIFDRVLKRLEYKLSGTHNRIYDLLLFVSQLENGFSIHW